MRIENKELANIVGGAISAAFLNAISLLSSIKVSQLSISLSNSFCFTMQIPPFLFYFVMALIIY